MNEARLKEIEAGTRCATCRQGYYPARHEGGQWVHLYEDGCFIGPCFDPVRAELVAEVKRLRRRRKRT